MNENEKLKENIKSTMAVEGCMMKEKDFAIIDQYLHHEIELKDGIDRIKSEFSK